MAHPRDEETKRFLLNLGGTIRSARRERELHQAQLGASCGVAAARVSEIECGLFDTSVSRVWRIARALGLTLSELFTRMEAATASEAETRDRRRRIIATLEQLPVEDLVAVEVLGAALAGRSRRHS